MLRNSVTFRKVRWAFGYLLAAMFMTVGCDLVSVTDAREALESAREVQQIQAEHIRPLLATLDQLEEEEIYPREQELHALERQIRSIHREQVEPLEEQLHELYPDHDVFSAVQEEFEARVRELEEKQRRLEIEGRELTRGFQEEEHRLRTGLETTIRAKEELMEQVRRQLDELYRNGWTPVDDLYRERDRIHEQFATVSQSSPDTGALQQQLDAIETQIALNEAHL